MDINIKDLTKEQRDDLLRQLQEHEFKKKRWKPKDNERYYYTVHSQYGATIFHDKWSNHYVDNIEYYNNNIFPYTDEGKKQAEHKLKIERGRYEFLELIAKINEEDECPEDFPNWDNCDKAKYHVIYRHDLLDFCSFETYTNQNCNNNEYCYREIKESELTDGIKYFLKYR